jgi:ribosomal protein L21E
MGIEDRDTCQNLDLETWLQEEELMQQLVHQHLLRAQTKMKHQADSKRSFRQFSVGDSVYLKIQPYIQTSLSSRSFTIVDRIGRTAYKLALPPTSSIHDVFHVSQLKHALSPKYKVNPELPDTTFQF